MYNYPYEYFRQQNMNTMNLNQMDNMPGMDFQMPFTPMQQQQPFNQMPTMNMQPIQPMMPMGTVEGATNGVPMPGTTSGTMPTNIGSVPINTPQFPQDPVLDTQYTQGWLTTQIGQRVKIEFLIGTNMLIDREGTLVDVGISYVIINEVETDDLLLCDIYSIKFVRIYK